MINCTVIDAGARYGLHPTWAELKGLADFHLFEMDPAEAARLESKYRNDKRIKVHPIALYSSDTTLKFHVSEHKALNSVFTANEGLLKRNDYMLRDFSVNREMETPARSIDSLFAGQAIHFMKLDVEGAELELLKGARRQLETSVLGVRSEVLFAPVYDGAALFGELNEIMLGAGFELLNLDYAGGGNKAGKFTLPGRYGKLISSDAVWIKNNDVLFSGDKDEIAQTVILSALFCMLNSASDIAIELLLDAIDKKGISFAAYEKDPLFVVLHRKALLLFKSLLGLPMHGEDEITSTYRKIFGRDFPLMHEFYQSDLFN